MHRPGGPSEAVSRAELSHAPALAALASKSSAASAPAIAARVRSRPSWPGGHRPVEEVVEVVHSVGHCRQQQAPRRQVVAVSLSARAASSNRCGSRGTLVAPAPGLHHIHSAPGARRPRHAVRLSRGTPSTTAPSLSLPSVHCGQASTRAAIVTRKARQCPDPRRPPSRSSRITREDRRNRQKPYCGMSEQQCIKWSASAHTPRRPCMAPR